MDLAAVRGTSPWRHTQAFLDLQHLVHYDASLHAFFILRNGRMVPCGWIVELVLFLNGTPFTSEEEISAPATSPEMAKPVPTTDAEPEPAMIRAPATRTEPRIIPEPEPDVTSDQVCEPATSLVPVEFEGMTWSPTPSTSAEEKALIDWESVCIQPVPFSRTEPITSSSPELSEFEILPCLPLPPPLPV